MLAPRQSEGGEAVNMISGFELDHPRDGWFGGPLTIRTQFASGAAALAAAGKPAVAAAIMNVTFLGINPPDLQNRKARAKALIEQHRGTAEVAAIAKRMGVDANTPDPADAVINALIGAGATAFDRYSDIIVTVLGTSF
jgi:hypothetical protein